MGIILNATGGFGINFVKNDGRIMLEKTYSNGTIIQGGIVINNGTQRFIVAQQDAPTRMSWSLCGDSDIYTLESIGSANINTANIVASCETYDYGAHYCSELSLSGYTDWLLPTLQEVQLMYTYKVLLNMNGDNYMSSSQLDSSAYKLVIFNNLTPPPSNGTVAYKDKNTFGLSESYVRPIRYF